MLLKNTDLTIMLFLFTLRKERKGKDIQLSSPGLTAGRAKERGDECMNVHSNVITLCLARL